MKLKSHSKFKPYLRRIFKEKNWHDLFMIGIFLKGLNGCLELISGAAFLFIGKQTFNNLFLRLAQGELLEDPHDRLVNYLAWLLGQMSVNTKIFVAFYIIFHGALNGFLAVKLWKDKIWAYELTLSLMIVFIAYQLYRLNGNHSLALAVITLFDILFVFITWHEYRYRRQHLDIIG